jgi:hypothetical protein
VQTLEVWVFEALFHRVALLRVEHQHLTQQVQSHWVRLRVEGAPTLLVSLGQLSYVLSCQVVSNEGHIFTSRCAKYSDRSLNLIEVVISREEWSSAKEFSEYAADGPNIKSI